MRSHIVLVHLRRGNTRPYLSHTMEQAFVIYSIRPPAAAHWQTYLLIHIYCPGGEPDLLSSVLEIEQSMAVIQLE